MLKKLFQYECRATARVLLPVYAGAAALTLVTMLLYGTQGVFAALSAAKWFRVLCGTSEFLTALGMAALFFVCIVINIQRFYKLLGDQGYLMFTLPATTGQHILARLLCSMVWTAATLAVMVLLALALQLPVGSSSGLVLDPGFVLTDDWPSFFLSVGYLLVLAALGVAFGYLLVYLCMAIGAHWPQQRLFASVVTYFVLQFALQLLVTLLVIGLGIWFTSRPESAHLVVKLLEDGSAMAHPNYALLLIPPALLLAADALVWFATHRLIDRHLNLA